MSSKLKVPAFINQFLLLSSGHAPASMSPLDCFAKYCFNVPRGFNDHTLDLFEKDFLYHLFSPDPTIKQDQFAPITRLMMVLFGLRPDLQSIFKLDTFLGRYSFVKWYILYGSKEVFRTYPYEVKYLNDHGHGANLVGFSHAHFGLGEFFSSTRNSLDQAGVPLTSLDTEDKELPLQYRINIFCLPGMEHHKLLFKFDEPLFEKTYNIGYWPWELAEWSSQYDFCFETSHETWTISKFSQESLQKSTSKPVHHMPIAVIPPEISPLQRKDFGLEESKFYFLCILDFNSYAARKNPIAAVKAFKTAFTRSENTGIIFKTLNLDSQNKLTGEFLKETKDDLRFTIINQELSREDLWALIRVSNCYVSLHRAEGFGLPIAEAMSLGLPAICTGYSGNMDFTREDNSFLVDYHLVEILPGEYHFFDPGQKWAEPSIEHAAQRMLEVFQHPEEAKQKAQKGKTLIETEFSTQAIGNRMKNRLEEIYREI